MTDYHPPASRIAKVHGLGPLLTIWYAIAGAGRHMQLQGSGLLDITAVRLDFGSWERMDRRRRPLLRARGSPMIYGRGSTRILKYLSCGVLFRVEWIYTMRHQRGNCGYSMWDDMIMKMQKALRDMPCTISYQAPLMQGKTRSECRKALRMLGYASVA
jgi:hypothetical protein